MIQYIFDKNNILTGKRTPNLNPKYNPDNPASKKYNYDPRNSLLVSSEIEFGEGETLQRDGDLINIVQDLRKKSAWVKETKEKIIIDYVGELKSEHTLVPPDEFHTSHDGK